MAKEANVVEAITTEAKARNKMENYLKYENNNYEEKMNIDKENIHTIETRKKKIQNNGGKSTKLYNQFYLKKMTYFLMILSKKHKDTANKAQFLPLEVKNKIK